MTHPPSSSQHPSSDALTDEEARIETTLTEWAIQCHTRDGVLHLGRAFTTEREAHESGARLSAINGTEWWLMTRHSVVTVERGAWLLHSRPTSAAGGV